MTKKTRMLLCIFISSFIFGVLDNGIMIVFGKAIDPWVASFCDDMMMSAGIGNAISDGAGKLTENILMIPLIYFLAKPSNDISHFTVLTLETVGIVTGCFFPLIFLLWG